MCLAACGDSGGDGGVDGGVDPTPGGDDTDGVTTGAEPGDETDGDTPATGECTSDAQCTGGDDLGLCEIPVCDLATGICGVESLPDGTKCEVDDPCGEPVGVCKGGKCEAEGSDCDDGDPCTEDGCDPAAGGCVSQPISGPACDDGSPCTLDDVCDEGACVGDPNPVCQCASDADCAPFEDADLCNGTLMCDGEQCVTDPATVITCDGSDAGPCEAVGCDPKDGECRASQLPDGDLCDDGDACTASDTCVGGVCGGKVVTCDDQNPCTDDSCHAAQGCVFLSNAGACDDGDLCTLDDQCAAGVCSGVQNPACTCDFDADCAEFEDGNLCNGTLICGSTGSCSIDEATVVSCDAPVVDCQTVACEAATGACVPAPALNGTPCDDGDACTLGDACVTGACAGQAPLSCDDGEACTTDLCDAVDGCVSLPQTGAACDDGDPCTVDDACDAGACAGTPTAACGCDVDADCAGLEDGDLCNGTLVCDASGACAVDPASVVGCGDEGPCVAVSCVPETGACVSVTTPDGVKCDDGDACTEGDACVAGSCDGAAVVCDDGDLCTSESCDPLVGCVSTWSDAPCDDGNVCTIGDTCKQGACLGTAIEGCVCGSDADCASHEDGDACNGTLTCAGAKCVVDPATVVTCPAPADPQCGSSQCVPETGACEVTTAGDGKLCDDGDACTEGDACAAGACVGADISATCDDDNGCTTDACDPAFGCVHDHDDGASCDDGDPCTGGDACLAGVCAPGATPLCEATCLPDWTLECGDEDVWSTVLPGATTAVDSWPCTPGGLTGPEYTYLFTAPFDGVFIATLLAEETFTDVLVLEQVEGQGCDPGACIAWDYASATVPMTAGATYYVVVDSPNAAGGDYTIGLECVPTGEASCEDGLDEDQDGKTDCDDADCADDPACEDPGCPSPATIGCGDVDASATWAAGSTALFDAYEGCDNPFGYPASEYIYTFTAATSGPVTAALSGETAETDIVVLGDVAGHCLAAQCLAYGYETVQFEAVAGSTYYLVVDGFQDAAGSFTLSVDCGDDPDPPDPEGQTCYPDLTSFGELSCPEDGDAWNNGESGSSDAVDSYACNAFDYAGPEYVYFVEADADSVVTVTLDDDGGELDLLLLKDEGAGCDSATCVDWDLETLTWSVAAGETWYVVVDGYAGAVGDYELTFSCGGR